MSLFCRNNVAQDGQARPRRRVGCLGGCLIFFAVYFICSAILGWILGDTFSSSKVELKDNGVCDIDMTLTAPSCPAADFLVEDIKQKVGNVEGITAVNVNLVFEPEWTKDMMSEEAKLELGFL